MGAGIEEGAGPVDREGAGCGARLVVLKPAGPGLAGVLVGTATWGNTPRAAMGGCADDEAGAAGAEAGTMGMSWEGRLVWTGPLPEPLPTVGISELMRPIGARAVVDAAVCGGLEAARPVMEKDGGASDSAAEITRMAWEGRANAGDGGRAGDASCEADSPSRVAARRAAAREDRAGSGRGLATAGGRPKVPSEAYAPGSSWAGNKAFPPREAAPRPRAAGTAGRSPT